MVTMRLRVLAAACALLSGGLVQAKPAKPLFDSDAPLQLTSTVRDATYQGQLVTRNGEATRGYSLHTTGWAFDIERRYASREQAQAFQFMLDRLQALNLIAWVREPAAIHITVSSDAKRLQGLLDKLPKG